MLDRRFHRPLILLACQAPFALALLQQSPFGRASNSSSQARECWRCPATHPTTCCAYPYGCLCPQLACCTACPVLNCYSNCVPCPPVQTFDCQNTTGQCIANKYGRGKYKKLAGCQSACKAPPTPPPPPAPTFDCDASGVCHENDKGTGDFKSLQACQAACQQ